MIFVKDKIFLKVWKISKITDKYMDLQGTTGDKRMDGTWVDSHWFPRVIGTAMQNLKGNLKEGDTLIVNRCKLTNETYVAQDGTKKNRFNFIILDAEIKGAPSNAPAAPTANPNAGGNEDEDFAPW